MIRKINILWAAWSFGFAILSFCHAQETTWESPPISTQLEMDNTIVPVGKGAIFCPSMTDPENEKNYGVLVDGRIVNDSKMGQRIVLAPGIYTVVLGSGTIDQMIKKKVRVVEGATTVIKPDWSGIVIEVINESRTNIREYYELFDLKTGVSYGIGRGVEEGLDENIRTWILAPGVYKILQPGDNINSVINFGTIRLAPGELVRASLVIDSKTGNFLGFGRVSDVRQENRREKKWRSRSELAGNALLNYIPSSESGVESEANFTSTVQWLTDARYESGRHVIPVWSNLEEGLSMQKNREFNKYIDKAELKLTYIFRLKDYLSPYIRFAAETRLFKTHHRFEEPIDYVRENSKGDTLEVINDAMEIKLGDPFSPVYLKQGFGITSILVKSVPVNFNLRSGYGARQIFARGASIFNTDTNVLSSILETDITGIEFLMLGDIRIGRYILFNTEFDILMPESSRDTWVYDSENRLRLNLTSQVSLLFTFEFWKDENVRNTQFRYQTLLRFSKYL
ncbi:hypothetical protein ACFL1R_07705 [Candidatus Latescibacterota bacterium]